jgi:hypothetical protein
MQHILSFLIVIFLAALPLAQVHAADDFGPRFQNIEPSAMGDSSFSRLNMIEPAAGGQDMDAYFRGLFGTDMKGEKLERFQTNPSTPGKSPIVRIYAEPL